MTTDQLDRECEMAARQELAYGAVWDDDAIRETASRAAYAYFALLSYCSGDYVKRRIQGVERAYRRILFEDGTT